MSAGLQLWMDIIFLRVKNLNICVKTSKQMWHDSTQIHWGASCCLCISVSHPAVCSPWGQLEELLLTSVCVGQQFTSTKSFFFFYFLPNSHISKEYIWRWIYFIWNCIQNCWYFCMEVAINFSVSHTLRTQVSIPNSLLISFYLNQSFLSAFFQVWSWFDRF